MRALKNLIHFFSAHLANIWFGSPSAKMYVIGVTGTDGKTTTSSMIYDILHESGKKVALISTVGAYIGGKRSDVGFHVTTPSPWKLQKYIKQAKQANTEYLVLEVTSHALDQNRTCGIHFDTAVLTNITHEHLDYHKTFEAYRNTKLSLFQRAKVAVLNRDDPSFDYFEKHLFGQEIVSYSLTNEIAHFTPKKLPLHLKLLGDFNLANALAAAAAASQTGVSEKEVKHALSSFEPPAGRQEFIYNKNFTVMIDFAHTPNAFAEILPAVRKQTSGRLVHVFGSAGLRDQTKRPLMGKESARFADVIILTAEDPRTEKVENIMDEISTGVQNSKFETLNSKEIQNSKIHKKNKYLFKIPNRKEAIECAIALADKGDTVLLTGKGHEQSMNYGHGEVEWDEKKVALEAVRQRLEISKQ